MDEDEVTTYTSFDGTVMKKYHRTGITEVIAPPFATSEWRPPADNPSILEDMYWDKVKGMINKKDEEELVVNITKIDTGDELDHVFMCDDEADLSVNRILKTLSVVKNRLLEEVAPIHIAEFICMMSPMVRQNVVTASKRLKMYGKKRPIVARFDEYGNQLPDEINIDISHGITLKIVNPKEYGEFFLELKAIEFPKLNYKASLDQEWEPDFFADL